MLKLIQVEFCKLRRKKLIWSMLSAAFVMPFFAFLYFHYYGKTGVDPVLFYKWSAFGYTLFIILPFILGMLCTMLMHDENRYDMLKQLWIVPVSRMGYFFSKFFVVFTYSVCFMFITALASVLFSVLPGYVVFEWNSILLLFEKCLEIAVFSAFAVLPLLAVAASQKGYVLSICVTLIYILAGFFIIPVNNWLHPISGISVIISRNMHIPGFAHPQAHNTGLAFLSICAWSAAAAIFANIALRKRK